MATVDWRLISAPLLHPSTQNPAFPEILVRLWSLHPNQLDAKGLVALWREGLLAAKVIAGGTKGYRHHPQLQRFLQRLDPELAVQTYLTVVLMKSQRCGYAFNATKIEQRCVRPLMSVTSGRLRYEWEHLKRKLPVRAPDVLRNLPAKPLPHPCFSVVRRDVEDWERVLD